MTIDTKEEIIIDSQINNEEEIVSEEENVEEEKKPIETPEAKYARISRMKEQLEKKLGLNKKEEKPVIENKTIDMSTSDIMALINAGIQEDEDIEEVRDYAQLKKISIKEALKSSIVKATLAEKLETRKTADATNVSNARRSPAKVTGEVLLQRANKGEMPESDEDIVNLIKFRRSMK